MENEASDLEEKEKAKKEAPLEETPAFVEELEPLEEIFEELSETQEPQASLSVETAVAPDAKDPEEPTEELVSQNSLFSEEEDVSPLAEIDFGLLETGRWLLKVIGGPNNGAEFYMQTASSYVIGTDPKSCDIVFNDTSVSRQHARISISPEEEISIEDLNSRNGVLVSGSLLKGQAALPLNTIVTLGTSSFVIYDREGEMQTIISPLLPSIVKSLQQDGAKTESAAKEANDLKSTPKMEREERGALSSENQVKKRQTASAFAPYLVIAGVVSLFVLAGIGTSTLFHDEPASLEQNQANANELIEEALHPFPSIRWTFNKTNHSLLIFGHLSNAADKSRLLYKLSDLKFIKSIDDSGIILDEGVVNEVNSLLSRNIDWKGIRIYSPSAGQFVLTGNLKTRRQAELVSSYLNLNFPYLDLLQKQLIVDEDLTIQIQNWLHNAGLVDVGLSVNNGEAQLSGAIPLTQTAAFNDILNQIKQLNGIRIVSNQTTSQSVEPEVTNVSDRYSVNGTSRLGNKFTVVINGRFLSEGDDLDGMIIDKISANSILLHKGPDKFRIDY